MRRPLPFLLLSALLLSACVSTGISDSSNSDSSSIVSSSDSVSSNGDNTSKDTSETTPETTSSESTSSLELPEGEYRLNPIPSQGDVGFIYNEYGQVMKEIYKDEYYTDIEDVAAYIAVFSDVPDNYYFTTERGGYSKSKEACYGLYGDKCRIYPGPYESNYSHLPYSLDSYYNEADVGGDGYATSASWNRGALRIVFTLSGIEHYGDDAPVVFYTDDHYGTFVEYKNYHGGWSPAFGDNGLKWSPIDTWF